MPNNFLSQIRGGRGRLDDCRNACKYRRRQLFEHPPDGKVECVDVHGRAFERDIDVLANKAARLRKTLDISIYINVAVGQFASTLARVDEQRADAAVNIDPRVAFRGTG